MTLVAPRRIQRIQRCALTGALLTSDSLKLHVAAPPLKRRTPGYLESQADAGAISAPLTLHCSQQEGAVGLAYAVMMQAYLEGAIRDLRQEKRIIDRKALEEALQWWRNADGSPNEYCINRVRVALIGKMPDRLIPHVLEVVLTCHREQADPSEIARRFGEPVAWVESKIDLCMRVAGYHRVNCRCLKCETRRAEDAGEWEQVSG